jgi:hypothetical protein
MLDLRLCSVNKEHVWITGAKISLTNRS